MIDELVQCIKFSHVIKYFDTNNLMQIKIVYMLVS